MFTGQKLSDKIYSLIFELYLKNRDYVALLVHDSIEVNIFDRDISLQLTLHPTENKSVCKARLELSQIHGIPFCRDCSIEFYVTKLKLAMIDHHITELVRIIKNPCNVTLYDLMNEDFISKRISTARLAELLHEHNEIEDRYKELKNYKLLDTYATPNEIVLVEATELPSLIPFTGFE